jgi:RNA polymerase-binding transcription factor DksA
MTTYVDSNFTAIPALDSDASERLRARLMAQRAEQIALVAEREKTMVDLTGQSDVDSILERELAEASAARARDAIDEIDDAFARMDAGTYGVCRACDGPIAAERLQVLPHARLCIRCSSEERERTR